MFHRTRISRQLPGSLLGNSGGGDKGGGNQGNSNANNRTGNNAVEFRITSL